MEQPALPFKDWTLVFVVVLVLAMLIITNFTANQKCPEISAEVIVKPEKKIIVYLAGAVEKPGEYQLTKGATLNQLLELAKPLSEADLSVIDQEKQLRNKQKIFIPLIGKVTVFVTGEVENGGYINLPVNAKISDLKSYIVPKSHADLTFLKSRRKLKQGEKIIVQKIQ